MARTKFRVEVLTPEGEVFNDEVEMVSTRTTTGSIGVLAHHTPVLAMLDPTELRLYKTESEVVRFAQAEGYMQVGENRALLLVEEAYPPGQLDASDLRERLSARTGSSRRPATTPSAGVSRSGINADSSGFCRSHRLELVFRRLSRSPPYPRPMLDERTLAERLISYDTSRPEELVAAAGFVKGWLESREIEVRGHDHNGLPVLLAEVGAAAAPGIPCVILHGHLDVVPGRAEQFDPVIDGDRLIGRGAYDMKGGLAAMMCALKDRRAPAASPRQARVRSRRGIRGAR